MKLSLCTWVKDWPPLKQCLPINLALTAGRRDVEFVIVDLGSKEPVADWVDSYSDPRVVVVRLEMPSLHFARAYNLSHRLATGDVLAALDGDNVIGPQYVDRVLSEIAADRTSLVHCWSGDWLDGTCGRIALHRELFERLGGYDESLEAIGHQDIDLRDRAKAMGCMIPTINDPAVVGLAIRTRDEDKLQHLPGVSYKLANAINVARSQERIARGWLKANCQE